MSFLGSFFGRAKNEQKGGNMIERLEDILKEKIMILDGATGTAIQDYSLGKESYIYCKRELVGCHEILNLTRRDVILDIHRRYIQAGADIIETNTFNANWISLEKYGIGDLTYKLAYEGAAIAREAALEAWERNGKKVWVAGSLGPTSKSASIPTKENPISREVEFDELLEKYKVQAEGLIEGGADILLIETIFDGLNAKAAVIAAEEVFELKGRTLPIMISATVDREGRLLSGQDIYSLIRALDRDSIVSFGLNCSFGAKDLIPLVRKVGEVTGKYLSIYPNAGLPNAEGRYDELPETTLEYLKPLIDSCGINIIGGCCGTTPHHIDLISSYSQGKKPRVPVKTGDLPFLSGNALLPKNLDFLVVGERNNVAGSRKFRRLIEEKKYEEALEISRYQIERGAHIIDLNLDDALLDSVEEMKTFLKILGNDAYTSKVPVMIDSSNFRVVEEALKNIPGRAIVNSISLKEGEEEFLRKASLIKKYGSAVVVMAFDEKGQAVTSERKIDIARKAYKLLTDSGWDGRDIVFDTNILTIGTGRNEDRYHAVSFLQAVSWIRDNLPGARTIGGVSNLSFAFRGNNPLRRAIHTIFLERAREEGLSMAIVNPGEEENPPEDLRGIIEELLEGQDVVEKILDYNFDTTSQKKIEKVVKEEKVEERLKTAILRGGSSTFRKDIDEALTHYRPLEIIQEILMEGMTVVGDKFESGELYLPQIIRSASVMEEAVGILTPLMEKDSNSQRTSRGKILMATVRGDVHDIGKNITATVLKCNGYEVIDLGVMVEKEVILEEAVKNSVDLVTLSGLISPSLTEMEEVVSLFNEKKLNIPILIGGAATSRLHSALKLEPKYKRKVFHVTDASSTLPVVERLLRDDNSQYTDSVMDNYSLISEAYYTNKERKPLKNIEEARRNRKQVRYTPVPPKKVGREYMEIPLDKLEPHINWDILLHAVKVKDTSHEERTLDEVKEVLERWKREEIKSKAAVGIFPCRRIGDTVEVEGVELPLVRDLGETNESLADYIEEEDYIGGFVASIRAVEEDNITHQLLANTLAEATSEYLENYITTTRWSIGLRPAIGYPCLPDHSMKEEIFKMVEGERTEANLTGTYAITPASTVCGIYLGNPEGRYINPKII